MTYWYLKYTNERDEYRDNIMLLFSYCYYYNNPQQGTSVTVCHIIGRQLKSDKNMWNKWRCWGHYYIWFSKLDRIIFLHGLFTYQSSNFMICGLDCRASSYPLYQVLSDWLNFGLCHLKSFILSSLKWHIYLTLLGDSLYHLKIGQLR